ncbi:protein-glutamate methylesterase/protein-glutamine glutaminase [Candidatus Methylobacter oryzae]|uniref:Protein-glutamate methylesterase/protein-glutamine glutaminase n=1 Tax=Candidatus Methylobacter oryzae TaxID=2497749 RepID=A0ABY3C9R1_9GAMM|nr:chemotaxis response regulator protein-glutamate methylesterase [Candidatus Methylobacter oryzae]TRW94350.1 chemotaxis response regulator protein-glutamate methylesterase [Candidatus Methylobacter oryzae]
MGKIRVLVIDDSALIRKILTEVLSSSPDIEVVGAAADPLIAREMIKQLNPDVLTLDIEMPHMDGITFLSNLMRLRPTPVVMISTLTEHGAEATLNALSLGAVDFIAKPKVDVVNTLNEYADEIISKVIVAAQAKVGNVYNRVAKPKTPAAPPVTEISEKHSVDVILKAAPVKTHISPTNKIIALGASTGGTEAIKTVVKGFPADTPPILITQHLPAAFSESFVRHIDLATEMSACIPKHGQTVESGHIYLSPGDKHMLVIREGGKYIIQLSDGLPVNRHKPAVDVLFRSVAQCAGGNAVGVLLTGMGADGAMGMKEMHDAGAKTVIQDEQSSVVWGMPGAAFKLGCTDYVVSLDEVSHKVLSLVKPGSTSKVI